ncbi:MAG: low molecular weight protein-tyrosine-phosphatase [Micrococcales bacterium]|nr:low molecular weight protein-tyrosine-phosphatase [Micrococcales bacterium]
MESPYRICVVCSGNICRSPMAQIVLARAFADAGLADNVEVSSAGTGGWHLGSGADDRALAALAGTGYDGSGHRVRRFEADWLEDLDLVLCADAGHLREVRAMAQGSDAEIRLLREFDPHARDDLDLADPYYGDQSDFEECLRQIERAGAGAVDYVRAELAS